MGDIVLSQSDEPVLDTVSRRAEIVREAARLTDELTGDFGVYYAIEDVGTDGKARQRLTRNREEAAAAAAAGKHVHRQFAAPGLARLAFIVGVSSANTPVETEQRLVGGYIVQEFRSPGAVVVLWLKPDTLTAVRADALVAVEGPNGVEYGSGTVHVSERAFASDHAFVATALTRAYSSAVARAVGGRNRPADFSEEEMLLARVRTPAELTLLARQLGLPNDAVLRVAGVGQVTEIPAQKVKEVARKLIELAKGGEHGTEESA